MNPSSTISAQAHHIGLRVNVPPKFALIVLDT